MTISGRHRSRAHPGFGIPRSVFGRRIGAGREFQSRDSEGEGDRLCLRQKLAPKVADATQRHFEADRSERRCFLFLQGHPSPFWGELADALCARGYDILKINFGLADRVYWGRRPARAYRGSFGDWAGWLRAFLIKEGVTDILYYADRLPYHATANTVAKQLGGIRCWAVEFGYLRPDWLTLEPNGMGPRSSFPTDIRSLERLADGVPKPEMEARYGHAFAVEAFFEVSFHLIQAFGRPFYPFYWSDKLYWPVFEYVSWLPELFLASRRERLAGTRVRELKSKRIPFNLVALQIETDYQVRCNSRFGSLAEFVEDVLRSFATHAPSDRHLVFKVHPLDSGFGRWFSRIPAMAREHGVGPRVSVLRGGDLEELILSSRGVVLVNSTTGLHAIRLGKPVIALGSAIYDIGGLTHQGGLDTFWTAPAPVSQGLYRTFERAISRIQVKGSFFDRKGRQVAVSEFVNRLGTGYAFLE